MNAAANKQLVQQAFEELAKGNRKPFAALMADDFTWKIIGSTLWSGAYRGKQEVREKLFEPLFTQFADQYTNTAQNILAEDDYVVVECRGQVMTKTGKPYRNEYCYVIRFAAGKMLELTEYCDTELIANTLSAPNEQSTP